MRVLVTGGAGFIGSRLAARLCDLGHEVGIIDDLSFGIEKSVPRHTRLFRQDIRDGDSVLECFESFEPTHVFHLAARISVMSSKEAPSIDREVNFDGSLNLLKALYATTRGKFVFASTAAVYGETGMSPVQETAELVPTSPYGRNKRNFERLLIDFCMSTNMPFTVLRYANVFGPGQRSAGDAAVIPIFCRQLFDGRPVIIYGRETLGDEGCIRDYVFVDDVVEANLLTLDENMIGTFNVSSGLPTTTARLLQLLSSIAGHEARVQYAEPRNAEVKTSILDPTKVKRKGWTTRIGLESGLEAVVRSYLSTGQRAIV